MTFSADNSPDSIKFNRKKLFATRFPTIDVTCLNNQKLTLPDSFLGKPSIVYLAGPTADQNSLNSWSVPLRPIIPNPDVNPI
jgi:hypothetical protein